MGEERILRFTVEIIVEPDGEEFHAYAPALKGVHSAGDSEDEALANAADAAIAYIRSLIKHGEPIPIPAAVAGPKRNGKDAHAGVHKHPRELELSLT
jgi:predicted RNase H-like HicB family nuclease